MFACTVKCGTNTDSALWYLHTVCPAMFAYCFCLVMFALVTVSYQSSVIHWTLVFDVGQLNKILVQFKCQFKYSCRSQKIVYTAYHTYTNFFVYTKNSSSIHVYMFLFCHHLSLFIFSTCFTCIYIFLQ